MSVLKPASEPSVALLKTLFEERFGKELPQKHYVGASQSAVSAKIEQLQGIEATAPASVEKQDEVIAVAGELGITVVPSETMAGCNRQIRDLTKRVRSREYTNATKDFEAFLDDLRPQPEAATADAEAIPF